MATAPKTKAEWDAFEDRWYKGRVALAKMQLKAACALVLDKFIQCGGIMPKDKATADMVRFSYDFLKSESEARPNVDKETESIFLKLGLTSEQAAKAAAEMAAKPKPATYTEAEVAKCPALVKMAEQFNLPLTTFVGTRKPKGVDYTTPEAVAIFKKLGVDPKDVANLAS